MAASGRSVVVLAMWIVLLGGLHGIAEAQTFSFEMMGGSAYNVPMPLTVRQTGYPDIHLTADYSTKPFGPYAPYFSLRVTRWNAAHTHAWELTEVHHRLFLTNNPPDIQYFAIHFGYNFFLLGHAWQRGGFIYHFDGGVVICAPVNTVRGFTLDPTNNGLFGTAYHFAGGGAQLAVSRRVSLTNHLFAVADLALMSAWARVPVANGSADVPNLSLHGRVGMGISF